ncbi:unnamed protein product [Durusdinium trenchii]|uniref:Uncharacterized protein n=1 Tax=Durusdinium trenchii TaxID=1381693 RepID=A0ABP0NBD6_9DINO
MARPPWRPPVAVALLAAVAAEVCWPEPLANFSQAGYGWPASPCRTFAGVGPGHSDGKYIYTPTVGDLAVWNDQKCSKNVPVAHLRVARVFEEQVEGLALFPPKILVVASRTWNMQNRNFWSRLRFYDAGKIGSSADSRKEHLFVRTIAGTIASVLVMQEDLLVTVTNTYVGGHYIRSFPRVLLAHDAPSVSVSVPDPLRKILAFRDFIVAASVKEVFILPHFQTSGEVHEANWTVPSNESATQTIIDMCIFGEKYLAVAANGLLSYPVAFDHEGPEGFGHFFVFDMSKAFEVGLEGSLVMTHSTSTILCVSPITGIGFAVGTQDNQVLLFHHPGRSAESAPYKRLKVVKSAPTRLHFIHGAFLAVGSNDFSVEIFDLKTLLPGRKKMLPSLVLPVESQVVDFLELPGLAWAVAGLHQVQFFGAQATANRAGNELASFNEGRVSMTLPLSQSRVALGLRESPEVLVHSVHKRGIRLELALRLPHNQSFATVAIEMAGNLLVVGQHPRNVSLYNLSGAISEASELASAVTMPTGTPVTSLACRGSTLLAGCMHGITVLDAQQQRTISHLRLAATVWSIVDLGNGLWAAGSDSEEVMILSLTERSTLTQLKKIPVTGGPPYAMLLLSQTLLVATDLFLHVFQGMALDTTSTEVQPRASLAVNMVHSHPPTITISLLETGLLLGLDLYRPKTPTGLCGAGSFSPPGDFECRPCPDGWSSFGAAGSCNYPMPKTLMNALKLLLLGMLLMLVVIPQTLALILKFSKASLRTHLDEMLQPFFVPYAMVLLPALCAWAAVRWRLRVFLAVVPLLSAALGLAHARAGLATGALICLAASSLAAMLCCLWVPVYWDPMMMASVLVPSANAYLTMDLRRWLHNPFVTTGDGTKANTAGARMIIMAGSVVYSFTAGLMVLTLIQHQGHGVWTPIGPCASRHGKLPAWAMTVACSLSMVAVGFAAKACKDAEDIHQPTRWARDEEARRDRSD